MNYQRLEAIEEALKSRDVDALEQAVENLFLREYPETEEGKTLMHLEGRVKQLETDQRRADIIISSLKVAFSDLTKVVNSTRSKAKSRK